MNIEGSFDPFFLVFGWVGSLLLLGVLLRSKIPFFRHYLVPSCLIGGIVGFILVNLGWVNIPKEAFATAAFHLFSLSNISIGLTVGGQLKGQSKTALRGGVWLTLIYPAVLSIQALTGAGVVSVWNLFGHAEYEGLGFLSGLGFSQGPGQVLAIADIWEGKYGVPNAVTIGVTFAAIGYFIALLVGVPLAYWGIEKGFVHSDDSELPEEFHKGIYEKEHQVEMGRQTTHSANVDTLAFHIGMVALLYGVSYILCYILKYYVLDGPAENLTFNYIYAYGLVIGLFARWVMNQMGIGHLIDPALQSRITGSMIDFLILATLMSIQLNVLTSFIVPMVAIVVVVTIITTIIIVYLARRTMPEHGFERMMLIFGTCTGSVATGLLLVRIVDPEFKTPVLLELSLMQLLIPFPMLHIVLFIGIIPDPATFGVWGMAGIFAATAFVLLLVIRFSSLYREKSF